MDNKTYATKIAKLLKEKLEKQGKKKSMFGFWKNDKRSLKKIREKAY
jgi:hypothetical protein